ncbi:MAG: hypothetical protein FWF29_07625 [Treponema sp.]|nr:hypothetical protein [Treponema sp.]
MADTSIEYSGEFGIDTFKHEIIREVGEKIWNDLIQDITVPNIDTECKCKCINMVTFMERFNKIIDKDTGKKILSKVRHGLKPSQSAWAREKFLKIGDLDEFIKQILDESISNFEKMYAEKKDFYGDTITKEVLDFLKSSPSTLAAIREGNKLHITAFPAQMDKYLHTEDPKMKRYYACHCVTVNLRGKNIPGK